MLHPVLPNTPANHFQWIPDLFQMTAITNDMLDSPCGVTDEAMKTIYETDFLRRGKVAGITSTSSLTFHRLRHDYKLKYIVKRVSLFSCGSTAQI